MEQIASEIVENHISPEEVNTTVYETGKPTLSSDETVEEVVRQHYPVEVPFAVAIPVTVQKEVPVPHIVEKPVPITKVS